METARGTGDGPGDEELINIPGGPSSLMKNLGKGIQEDITPLSTSGLALISRLHPNKCQPINILLHTNVTREHTSSKDKVLKRICLSPTLRMETWPRTKGLQQTDVHGITPPTSEEYIITLGESSSSKESLTPAIQGIVIHTMGSDLPQPDLQVVAVVTPAPAAPAQSNVAMLVTFPGVAPAEPNVGPIVALYNVAPAQINTTLIVDPSSEPLVEPNVPVSVPTSGLAFARPSVAAAPVVAPVQPHVAPNDAPSIGTTVAPPRVAPAQPNDAVVAAPHVAPLALAPAGQNPAVNVARPVVAAQQNVAPVVAHPAPAQPNAAAVVAPPGVPPALPYVIDINGGLTRSQLSPRRTFESGQEGNLWPKLGRN